MAEERIIRLRCRAEAQKPGLPEDHYAVDLRAPMPFAILAALGSVLGTCACGEQMVAIWGDAPDPWVREPGAR